MFDGEQHFLDVQIDDVLHAVLPLLAANGWAQPWHLTLTALVSGAVWSVEMATRRRMVGEAVPTRLVGRALALDTLSGSLARLAGPIAAGALYEFGGLTTAFVFSTGMYALAAGLGAGLHYRQEVRALVVTILMNLLAFPYSALIAPIGQLHFQVSPVLIGVMAAAESFGGFLGGLRLAGGDPPGGDSRGGGRVLMVGGSLLLLGCIALMPLMPWFWLACLLLVIGGVGQAAHAALPVRGRTARAPPPKIYPRDRS